MYELLGSLMTHDLTMKNGEKEKNTKGIALKPSALINDIMMQEVTKKVKRMRRLPC